MTLADIGVSMIGNIIVSIIRKIILNMRWQYARQNYQRPQIQPVGKSAGQPVLTQAAG